MAHRSHYLSRHALDNWIRNVGYLSLSRQRIGKRSGHGYARIFSAGARSSEDFGAIISDVNRQLVQDVEDSGQFITMFFLDLSSDSKQLEWVRAGYDPAIVYDPHSDTFNELRGPIPDYQIFYKMAGISLWKFAIS